VGLFSGANLVTVVPPSRSYDGGPDDRELRQVRDLIARERFEFEVEMGTPVEIRQQAPEEGPRFLLGPRRANPAFDGLDLPPVDVPTLRFDRSRDLLVADAPDLGGVVESLSLLRTLATSGGDLVTAADCDDLSEAVRRIEREVATTYPAFELRGLDWPAICARHVDRVLSAVDPLAAMQRWVAELEDMHTWVHPVPRPGLLPYAVHAAPDAARFVGVPPGTPAFDAGIRPGDTLEDVDPRDAWERTGAPSHLRPLLAGRRLVSGPVGVSRAFRARTVDGRTVTFRDVPTYQPWDQPAHWTRLDSGSGYLRLHGFPPGLGEIVDAAFDDLGRHGQLIVDLRGNAGGMLIEALDFRDRFLDRAREMGTIRFSTPEGGLSRAETIQAEPAPERARWFGPVRLLTNPLTVSASEDALLGLQGLPHVRTVGTNTGGGSGRPRLIRLLPGQHLTVSTALTYDREGRCVEGSGIPADVPVPLDFEREGDRALVAAERDW
jgi:carboxyl-terminal processing protease